MVRREVVGAHYGLRGWLVQRMTAVFITVYLLLFFGILLLTPGMDLARWQTLWGNAAFKVATFVALLSVFLHTWVGMRDIIMDYARPTAVRLTLEVLVIGALVVYAGWSIQILWGQH